MQSLQRTKMPKKGNLFSDIKSEFSAKGVIEMNQPLDIFYKLLQKGTDLITFPNQNDAQIKKMIEESVPSGFGKGNKNVQDPTYRNARQIVQNRLGFSPYYSEILSQITNDISKIMGNGQGVRADLIKLNIYSTGCFFKGHVDSPKGSAFGSLVVFLPYEFQGGVLKIQHEKQNFEYSFGGKQNSKKINWAAFYNDCVHQITEVKSGFRITLSYNLFQQPISLIRSIVPNQKIVQRLSNSLQPGIQYIYECQHYYGNNALQFASSDPLKILKGKDAEVWIAAKQTKFLINLNILIQHQAYSQELDKNLCNFYLGKPQKIKQIKAGVVDHEDYGSDGFDSFTVSSKNLQLQLIPPQKTISYLNKGNPKSQKYIYAIDGYYGNDYNIDEKYCELVISIVVPEFQIK